MTQPPITVLVVDDEEHIRSLLETFFKQQGCKVLLADNGDSALKLKALGSVDVALIDIFLTGDQNGHELLSALHRLHPEMSKILMSGQGGLDDAIAAFAEHAFSFARKPFASLSEIWVLVQSAAQAKRLAVQNREYSRQLEQTNADLEERVVARTEEIQRYQTMLAHLFGVTSQIGRIEQPDQMLEFICQSIVEAGAFQQAVILLANEKFYVRHVGVWAEGGVPDNVRESLRALKDQPLRPFDYNVLEERIGTALLSHTMPIPPSEVTTDSDKWHKGDQLSIPLVRHDGAVFGYLTVTSPVDGNKPRLEIVRLLEMLLNHGALQIEAHDLQQELKRHAEELELRVHERTNELRLSQEKFSRLVNSTTDIVYIADENDKVIYLNEAFTKTLGYIRENYIGRSLKAMLSELVTDNPTNRRSIQELESTSSEHTIHHIELLTRQGDKRTLEINRSNVWHGGAFKGSQGIIRDISEHRALLQQLVSSERLAATGRLAAGIAHEINNPLQAIASHLSTCVKKFDAHEDVSHNVELISEGIERIRQIVRGLLDLHRTPAVSRAPIDLNDVINRMVALLSRQLRESDVTVKMTLQSKLPAVQGSVTEIQQVVLNLILNAAQAMSDGGMLTITSRSGDTCVEVVFEDTGTGISQEHLTQIFEPFFTYRPSGSGVGLGLYLSKNIMDMHHGTIAVASEVGKGTTFTLSFPKE